MCEYQADITESIIILIISHLDKNKENSIKENNIKPLNQNSKFKFLI